MTDYKDIMFGRTKKEYCCLIQKLHSHEKCMDVSSMRVTELVGDSIPIILIDVVTFTFDF